MVHLLGTVQKKIIRIERMKIRRISPPANRNPHPANRVKNMKKLRRNSPSAGLKVNPCIKHQRVQDVQRMKTVTKFMMTVIALTWIRRSKKI